MKFFVKVVLGSLLLLCNYSNASMNPASELHGVNKNTQNSINTNGMVDMLIQLVKPFEILNKINYSIQAIMENNNTIDQNIVHQKVSDYLIERNNFFIKCLPMSYQELKNNYNNNSDYYMISNLYNTFLKNYLINSSNDDKDKKIQDVLKYSTFVVKKELDDMKNNRINNLQILSKDNKDKILDYVVSNFIQSITQINKMKNYLIKFSKIMFNKSVEKDAIKTVITGNSSNYTAELVSDVMTLINTVVDFINEEKTYLKELGIKDETLFDESPATVDTKKDIDPASDV